MVVGFVAVTWPIWREMVLGFPELCADRYLDLGVAGDRVVVNLTHPRTGLYGVSLYLENFDGQVLIVERPPTALRFVIETQRADGSLTSTETIGRPFNWFGASSGGHGLSLGFYRHPEDLPTSEGRVVVGVVDADPEWERRFGPAWICVRKLSDL